jgi:multiple sugar transport system permease protein
VFTRITVPLLSPMLAYVIITGFIGGFKEYSSIVGIFGDKMGPAHDAKRLNTMVGFIYDALDGDYQGRASAAALILFAIILLVTMFNNHFIKKHVHY